MSVPKFVIGDLDHTGKNIDLVLTKKKMYLVEKWKVYVWQNFLLSIIVQNLIMNESGT